MIYSITFVIWWSSILLEVTTNNNYLPSASYWQSISHTINTENRIHFEYRVNSVVPESLQYLQYALKHLLVHTTSLTSPFFTEVPVPSQESERSCICVLVVSNLPLSTILIFECGIVLTVWYIFLFSPFYSYFSQFATSFVVPEEIILFN